MNRKIQYYFYFCLSSLILGILLFNFISINASESPPTTTLPSATITPSPILNSSLSPEISPTALNLNNVVKDITALEFKKEVLESEIPVFVDIYAHWCDPCVFLSPIIDEAAKDLGNKVKFIKINGYYEWDNLNDLGIGIQYFPTLYIYDNGKVIKEIEPEFDKNYIIKSILDTIKK